jgi:hypothetical protein
LLDLSLLMIKNQLKKLIGAEIWMKPALIFGVTLVRTTLAENHYWELFWAT